MGGSPTRVADGSRRRGRLTVVLGAAAAFVVLAAVGATGGWLLAGAGASSDGGLDEPSPSASPAPRTPDLTGTAAAPTTGRPTDNAPPARTDQPVRVPDLVGADFERARRDLRELRLGWQLVFQASGDSRAVERLDPVPGTTVHRGTTVKVYVAGVAPPATVPAVVGLTCGQAKELVVGHGLYPDYPNGQAGQVVRQEPESPAELRWNDRVRLYCAPASPMP